VTNPKPLTVAQRRPYLDQLSNGGSATVIAKAAGVTTRTLYRWARDAGIDVSARHVSPPKTAAASEGARQSWAHRKATMADEIGEAAGEALDICRLALTEGAIRNAKDAALTLAILVDKAQLLSGAETSRNGVTADPHSLLEAGRARVSHLRPVKDA
jgi:hypothetical protein